MDWRIDVNANANAISKNAVKLATKTLKNGSIVSQDGVSTGGVDTDASHVHLEDRGLEGLAELVGGSGGVVELGLDGVEDLESDHAVEAVVGPESLGVAGVGIEAGGLDDLHERIFR